MPSNIFMILFIFAILIIVPTVTVFIVLIIIKKNRKRKLDNYTGITNGIVLKIVSNGLDHPDVIHVRYEVDCINYEIKETAKLKSETIKAGKIPIGQKKSYVMGTLNKGDVVTIRYKESNPKKAIIQETTES